MWTFPLIHPFLIIDKHFIKNNASIRHSDKTKTTILCEISSHSIKFANNQIFEYIKPLLLNTYSLHS